MLVDAVQKRARIVIKTALDRVIIISIIFDFDLSFVPALFLVYCIIRLTPEQLSRIFLNILLSSRGKIKTVNNCHLLQASNKAAGGETARHQDTRAVSGGTPAAELNTHRKYKRFLGKYSITYSYQRHRQISIEDFRRSQNIILL